LRRERSLDQTLTAHVRYVDGRMEVVALVRCAGKNRACVVPDVLPRGQNVSGVEAVLRVGLSSRGVEEQRADTRLKRFLVWD